MLGESNRGAQNQSMVPSVATTHGSLQVSYETVISNEWVIRHRPSILNVGMKTMLCPHIARDVTRAG